MYVYLTDDGSTDGTAEAVAAAFPDVTIIEGSGDLYWCRGTHRSWERAALTGYDGYLWLNDDVVLAGDAIPKLSDLIDDLASAGSQPGIFVGSFADPVSGETTYGGQSRLSRWHPGKLERVEPHPHAAIPIDTFNGNFVYVPADVVNQIGIIDPVFSHATGDTDYGLRAKKAGIPVLLAPGFFGTCRRNPPVVHDLRSIFGRKGLPWSDWLVFTRRHARRGTWPLAFAAPYVKALAKTVRR
jgi:GT2 family glycosyltransferase